MSTNEITPARIQRALDAVALAIGRAGKKGVVYLPIYERLERELETLRQRDLKMDAVHARVACLKKTGTKSSTKAQAVQSSLRTAQFRLLFGYERGRQKYGPDPKNYTRKSIRDFEASEPR